jgi:hypothetical protein
MTTLHNFKLNQFDRWIGYLRKYYEKKYQEPLPSFNTEEMREIYEQDVSYSECADNLFTLTHPDK